MAGAVSTTSDGTIPPRPLEGCRVVVTRERPGTLARLLRDRGADVVHVPLIEVVDPSDGGAALSAALAEPSDIDWVMVTSAAGAERVAAELTPATAAAVRIGAVGSATAERFDELIGRPADLVPDRQVAAALAAAFVELEHPGPQRVLVAQADRAGGDLVDGLRAGGHDVHVVTAYRTRLRTPTAEERVRLADSDAVLFASGSAASSWASALGAEAVVAAPPIVVAIGPSTAAVARDNGLKVSAVAADHSVPGIVAELESVWRTSRPESGLP